VIYSFIFSLFMDDDCARLYSEFAMDCAAFAVGETTQAKLNITKCELYGMTGGKREWWVRLWSQTHDTPVTQAQTQNVTSELRSPQFAVFTSRSTSLRSKHPTSSGFPDNTNKDGRKKTQTQSKLKRREAQSPWRHEPNPY
jgi:hypothetical protein